MDAGDQLPLRERKRLRTREALVAAALELFAEHGFEAVTVSDIARRAEVGRTTFFRHFADKKDVVFADEDVHRGALLEEVARIASAYGPIGDSITVALDACRAGLVAMVASVSAYPSVWLPARARLISETEELMARSLMMERTFVEDTVTVLAEHGADPLTAVLASHTAYACYRTAVSLTGSTPERRAGVIDEAFRQLAMLDAAALSQLSVVELPPAPASAPTPATAPSPYV